MMEMSETPDSVKCYKCNKKLSSGDDNYLGLNPEYCKHWCNECFKGILDWIESKKAKEILTKLQVQKVDKYIINTKRVLKLIKRAERNKQQTLDKYY